MTCPPKISTRIEVSPRPFWSVMIPAYQPNPDYLAQTLRSVLAQDPGPAQMQIEVVDDCSPGVDVAALVKAIAGERVKVSQTPKNLGLAGCWNTCIERARGEWVHILHQDDWVLPGFYERLENLIQATPGIGAAFSRNLTADRDGHWTSIGPLIMKQAGELENFDVIAATWVPMQCAAAIVNRLTYERLAGYRTDIPYVLDWEMWCRIAAAERWGYVPQPGAVYREHDQSESTRLRMSGQAYRDFLAGGWIARSHFSPSLQMQTASEFWNNFADYLLADATGLYVRGNLKEAAQLLDAFRGEVLKSKRRWVWVWLRLRVMIKPMRRWFGCSQSLEIA